MADLPARANWLASPAAHATRHLRATIELLERSTTRNDAVAGCALTRVTSRVLVRRYLFHAGHKCVDTSDQMFVDAQCYGTVLSHGLTTIQSDAARTRDNRGSYVTTPLEAALQERDDLDAYGKAKRTLFALQLTLGLDDVHTVATSALTDGPRAPERSGGGAVTWGNMVM